MKPYGVQWWKILPLFLHIMPTAIKLSDEFIQEVKRYAHTYHRSVPKQIEYWSRIGKIAEENPDLSYPFIKDILLSLEEERLGHVTPYCFD